MEGRPYVPAPSIARPASCYLDFVSPKKQSSLTHLVARNSPRNPMCRCNLLLKAIIYTTNRDRDPAVLDQIPVDSIMLN